MGNVPHFQLHHNLASFANPEDKDRTVAETVRTKKNHNQVVSVELENSQEEEQPATSSV